MPIPKAVPNPVPIPKSDENETEAGPPYGIIGTLVFVMMIIIPFAIKKSRKKKEKEFVINKKKGIEKEFERQKVIRKARERENSIEDQKIEDQRKKKLKEIDDEFEKQKQLRIKNEADNPETAESIEKTPSVQTTIPHIKITSSTNIASAGYDESQNMLEILFTSKTLYQFFEIPKELFLKLMDSESKGTFFHENIKDRFQYQRLETSNLKSKKHSNSKVSTMNQNPCPKCGIIPNIEDVESVFGMRQSGGKTIRQSYCRKCRGSLIVTPKKPAKPAIPEKLAVEENKEEELRKLYDQIQKKEKQLEEIEKGIEEAEENKEEELRKLYDQIQKKEKQLEEIEKGIEEAEEPSEKTEQNKPKFTPKEIRDFIKSRDSVSDADREMLEKVVELANQFPDESLLGIYENRYLTENTSERVEENQRRLIRFFKIFLNELHRQDALDAKNKKNNLDKLNELISSSLKIIRENPAGIDQRTLMKKLETSEENFERVLPRILRLTNISKELKLVNGVYKYIIQVEDSDKAELSPSNEPKQEIKNKHNLSTQQSQDLSTHPSTANVKQSQKPTLPKSEPEPTLPFNDKIEKEVDNREKESKQQGKKSTKNIMDVDKLADVFIFNSFKLKSDKSKSDKLYFFKNEQLLWQKKISGIFISMIKINFKGECIIVTTKNKIFKLHFIKIDGNEITFSDLKDAPVKIEFSNDILLLKDTRNQLTSYRIIDDTFKVLWQDYLNSRDKFEIKKDKIMIHGKNNSKSCPLYDEWPPS